MDNVYDLAIVGAGPAGLSAAINGASELPRVILIDSGKKDISGNHYRQLGGQAIGSSLIENYAGFPEGVSGGELMARFEKQALRLATEIVCPERVASLSLRPDRLKELRTKEGRTVLARAVLLANGLSYRRHTAVGIDQLLGRGVLYGAPTTPAHEFGTCTVCIIGGANSAGQAAMHFAGNPRCDVKILVRGKKQLGDQMSQYLVTRIEQQANIEVHTDVSVESVHGSDMLEYVTLKRGDGTVVTMRTNHLFVFIGAAPKTEWLESAVVLDERKFIATGTALGTLYGERRSFETSMTGVFAAGDVRHGSVKRVAAGVGEGSAVIADIHDYLASWQTVRSSAESVLA